MGDRWARFCKQITQISQFIERTRNKKVHLSLLKSVTIRERLNFENEGRKVVRRKPPRLADEVMKK
jgi:hypothetical protein